MKVAVLFHRFGPMHHARLAAAAQLGQVAGIEFSGRDETYDWAYLKKSTEFEHHTLFAKSDIRHISAMRVRHRMFDVLDKVRPDVVAIPGWSDRGALAALDWCLKTGARSVIMSDSTAYDKPRSWWKEAVKRRVVRLYSTALVGGSPHFEYARQLGIPEERIFTKYDVVDNAYFSQAALQVRKKAAHWKQNLGLFRPFFLASSRFIKKKNLFRLVQAYKKYLDRTRIAWDLVILGDGELRDLLFDKIEELGVRDRVHTPGFKQYEDLPIYYGLAQAFIHASTTEQWGLVVNEAMASGLPVLVSRRCGCAPDLVEQAGNGFLFDPYDIDEMSDAMLNIAQSRDAVSAMGLESRRIISQYTPEHFAENLLKASETAFLQSDQDRYMGDRSLIWALGGLKI